MVVSSNLTITRISEDFDIPGYVVDSEILHRIDAIAREAVAGTEDPRMADLEVEYSVTTEAGVELKFETIDSLEARLNSEPKQLESVSLEYRVPLEVGISLVFESKGEIGLSAFGDAPDFQFNIDRLTRELRRCDQEYGWLVRTFVFPARVRMLLAMLLFPVSFYLLFHIGYYLYALNVGVNIDPSLIPSGYTYFQEVEKALKSDSIARKLDVLLLAQLRDFKNVQDILEREERLVVLSLIALAIIVVLSALLRSIARLYPLSFFAFGRQKEVLSKLQRRREIWGVAVLLGFIVNIIAGLIVAFLT